MVPVVVQVSPAESPGDLRRALLESCGRAVKTTDCVEPRDPTASSDSVIVATVTWNGSDHVRLEVTLKKTSQVVDREIDFGPHDAAEERWRTAGLVVGTLASVLARNELPSAGELPEAPEPEAVPAPPSPEEPAIEAASPSTSTARDTLLQKPRPHRRASTGPRAFVDASGFVAPAISGGPFRLGGDVGGRIRFGKFPAEPAIDVAYSATPSAYSGVDTRVVDAFVGLAVTGDLGGPFSAVARAQGFFRWLSANAGESGALGPTEKGRPLGGARFGLDGVAGVADPFSIFIGAAGIFAAGSTDVTSQGRYVGNVSALSYELRAGVTIGL